MSRKPGVQDLGELDGCGLGGSRCTWVGCTQGWRNAAGHPDVGWEHLAELHGSAEAWVYKKKIMLSFNRYYQAPLTCQAACQVLRMQKVPLHAGKADR